MDACKPSDSKVTSVVIYFFRVNQRMNFIGNEMRMRKNATPTNETAKKTQRDFGTKALRRDGVQTSTPGGGMALSLMLRVRGAAECGA
jgi:hypothetical protein